MNFSGKEIIALTGLCARIAQLEEAHSWAWGLLVKLLTKFR
jgi:hypothetical protein